MYKDALFDKGPIFTFGEHFEETEMNLVKFDKNNTRKY